MYQNRTEEAAGRKVTFCATEKTAGSQTDVGDEATGLGKTLAGWGSTEDGPASDPGLASRKG